MAESKTRHIKSIVDNSQFWRAEDLLRNLEMELDRLEKGLGHMIWDEEAKPVAMCPCMLPVSPRFEVSETADEFNLKVSMPGVREEDLEVTVGKHSVEVYARQREKAVRPFLLSIDSQASLDPDRTRIVAHEDVFIIGVRKLKKHRVKVR